jgi:hypothetical protein
LAEETIVKEKEKRDGIAGWQRKRKRKKEKRKKGKVANQKPNHYYH